MACSCLRIDIGEAESFLIVDIVDIPHFLVDSFHVLVDIFLAGVRMEFNLFWLGSFLFLEVGTIDYCNTEGLWDLWHSSLISAFSPGSCKWLIQV